MHTNEKEICIRRMHLRYASMILLNIYENEKKYTNI